MAKYLFNGAMTPEQRAALLLEAKGVEAALEAMRPVIERELATETTAALEALHMAFVAGGDQRAQITKTIAGLDPYDWERHDELAMKLRLSLAKEKLYGHIAALDTYLRARADESDFALIDSLSWQRISAADKEMRETPPLTMHASREMLDLLAIKGDTLDLKTTTRLLMNQTADKEPIPGKVYAKPRSNGAEPTAFFEMLFFPDKSVSTVYGLSGPEAREAIRRVHEAAVHDGMREVTRLSSWVRYGAGGVNRERGEGTWITFGGGHTMSRDGDPHLHSHVALLNVVRSLESSRVGAFDLRNLHGHFASGTFERPYQAALGRGLAALGYDVGRNPVGGETTIRGVPEPVLRALSSRSELAKLAAAQEISFGRLTPQERAQWISAKVAETRRPSNEAIHGPHDWEERAIAAVGSAEWERMAKARGWVWQHKPHQHQQTKQAPEKRERNSAGLPMEYHRGGSRDFEWGLTSPASREAGRPTDWGRSR